MTFQAHPARDNTMPYRFCGKSGLKLPAISLGLWHNFGAHLRCDVRLTGALIGASSAVQITELVGALNHLSFSAAELQAIDQHAVEGGINLWQKPSTDQRP